MEPEYIHNLRSDYYYKGMEMNYEGYPVTDCPMYSQDWMKEDWRLGWAAGQYKDNLLDLDDFSGSMQLYLIYNDWSPTWTATKYTLFKTLSLNISLSGMENDVLNIQKDVRVVRLGVTMINCLNIMKKERWNESL